MDEVNQKSSKYLVVLFPAILVILWLTMYNLLIHPDPVDAAINMLNVFGNVISDGALLILIGLSIVLLYVLADFYFEVVTDTHSFTKIEKIVTELLRTKDYRLFIKQFTDLENVERPDTPIPKSIASSLYLISFYFVFNIAGYLLLSEILYLTAVEALSNVVFTVENSLLLAILAASFPIGGRIAALMGYGQASEYKKMLTEAMFILSLVGLIASLFESKVPNIFEIYYAQNILAPYLLSIFYLAIIAIIIELIYWYYYISKQDTKQEEQ